MMRYWTVSDTPPNNLVVVSDGAIIIGSPDAGALEKAQADRGNLPPALASTGAIAFADVYGVWNDPGRARLHIMHGQVGKTTTDVYVAVADRAMRDDIFAVLRQSLGEHFQWREVNPSPWERAKGQLMIAGTVAFITIVSFFGTLQALDPNFKERTQRGAAGRAVLGAFGRAFGAGAVLVVGGLIVAGILYWAWKTAYPPSPEPMQALLRRDLM